MGHPFSQWKFSCIDGCEKQIHEAIYQHKEGRNIGKQYNTAQNGNEKVSCKQHSDRHQSINQQKACHMNKHGKESGSRRCGKPHAVGSKNTQSKNHVYQVCGYHNEKPVQVFYCKNHFPADRNAVVKIHLFSGMQVHKACEGQDNRRHSNGHGNQRIFKPQNFRNQVHKSRFIPHLRCDSLSEEGPLSNPSFQILF